MRSRGHSTCFIRVLELFLEDWATSFSTWTALMMLGQVSSACRHVYHRMFTSKHKSVFRKFLNVHSMTHCLDLKCLLQQHILFSFHFPTIFWKTLRLYTLHILNPTPTTLPVSKGTWPLYPCPFLAVLRFQSFAHLQFSAQEHNTSGTTSPKVSYATRIASLENIANTPWLKGSCNLPQNLGMFPIEFSMRKVPISVP